MGVPYSHLTLEEMEGNRKFNEGRGQGKMEGKQEVNGRLEEGYQFKPYDVHGKWCGCNLLDEAYTYHVPPLQFCVLCRVELDNDHYHCGACLKLSQIG